MQPCLSFLQKNPEKCKGIEELLRHISGANVCDKADLSPLFVRGRATNKGDFGKACLVAGSEKYLGAAALCVAAALRSGCGYVFAVVPQGFRYALTAAYPQCIYVEKPDFSASAMAFGMGLGCTEETYSLLLEILKTYTGKLIIDADGLNALSAYGVEALRESCAQIMLTPHIGEMSRLCGLKKEEILADPVKTTQEFCRRYKVSVHLKNAVSVTCDELSATATTTGCSALAKAGSGDMLSGLMCGFAARGLTLAQAAVCAQYVLGLSAEICTESLYEGSVCADDVIKNIGVAIKRLQS